MQLIFKYAMCSDHYNDLAKGVSDLCPLGFPFDIGHLMLDLLKCLIYGLHILSLRGFCSTLECLNLWFSHICITWSKNEGLKQPLRQLNKRRFGKIHIKTDKTCTIKHILNIQKSYTHLTSQYCTICTKARGSS